MTKTENYNLNQWVEEDPIRRTDFNEDNAKLDAALHELEQGKAQAADLLSLQTVVSGKAQAAELTALQATVAGKADASTVTALQSSVAKKADASVVTALQNSVAGKANTSALNALQATVNAKGNCRVEFGSYVGTGGLWDRPSITASFPPKLIVVAAETGTFGIMLAGCTKAYCMSSVARAMALTWREDGVSWVITNSEFSPDSALNGANITYYYTVFG